MKVYKPLRLGYLSRVTVHAGRPRLSVALLSYFPFEAPRRKASSARTSPSCDPRATSSTEALRSSAAFRASDAPSLPPFLSATTVSIGARNALTSHSTAAASSEDCWGSSSSSSSSARDFLDVAEERLRRRESLRRSSAALHTLNRSSDFEAACAILIEPDFEASNQSAPSTFSISDRA